MCVQWVLIFVFRVAHCNEFFSCRTQTSLHQPSSKGPTASLSEVLLKLLSTPLPNPSGVQSALACYHVLVAVTPVPQRAAFRGSITSGQRLVSSWHVRGSHLHNNNSNINNNNNNDNNNNNNNNHNNNNNNSNTCIIAPCNTPLVGHHDLSVFHDMLVAVMPVPEQAALTTTGSAVTVHELV